MICVGIILSIAFLLLASFSWLKFKLQLAVFGKLERLEKLNFKTQIKLDKIMADIDVLEQRAEALETQVAEFQTALDREQAQVDAVLAANAGTAEELAAARVEISRLQTELADAGINVERIQAVNARLDGIAQSIITTREDLESTIPDTQEPDQPEGPENPGGEGEAEDGE